jgi:hypothetical protein
MYMEQEQLSVKNAPAPMQDYHMMEHVS